MVGNIEKGIIFLYEEALPHPEWMDYLHILSGKAEINLSPSIISKAIVFITLKGTIKKTFALTFGNGHTLLDTKHIVPDFGLKISKSLLSIGGITEINSMSIDRRLFNTKKQSIEFLMPEKILEYGTQNIIKNVYGIHKQVNDKFSVGGKDSLNFGGDIDLLNDLEKWLVQFSNLYTKGDNNLGISDDLISVSKQMQSKLDDKLGQKILDIINVPSITRKQTSAIKLSPNEIFDLETFNGFFITGLGYKSSSVTSDFWIDELDFFQRFQKQIKTDKRTIEGILKKIKTDKISRKVLNNPKLETVCTVYKAISYETKLNSKKYILVSGKWYEIDTKFYKNLQRDIDNIESPDNLIGTKFIDFDPKKHIKITKKGPQADEGKYNEDLAKQNNILMLDRQNYSVDKKTIRKYGFKPNTPIELSDVMYFDMNKIQFVHVKRHSGGASGTSHLLTQALVSAHAFLNDNEAVVNHINETVDHANNNNASSQILKLNYCNQNKEVVLAIVEERDFSNKSNSALLTLLEMISMRENIRNLEHLGFKCYLKFIPGHS